MIANDYLNAMQRPDENVEKTSVRDLKAFSPDFVSKLKEYSP